LSSSPGWEPPEQLPLTSQQLAPGFVFDLSLLPSIQNWRLSKRFTNGADILSAGLTGKTALVYIGDGAGAIVMQATDRDRLLGF